MIAFVIFNSVDREKRIRRRNYVVLELEVAGLTKDHSKVPCNHEVIKWTILVTVALEAYVAALQSDAQTFSFLPRHIY